MRSFGRKTEHVGHGIESRRLAARPQRRGESAAREDAAVLGPVGKFDALAGAGENHAVIAHNRAAAQARETNIARLARPREPVAPAERCNRKD